MKLKVDFEKDDRRLQAILLVTIMDMVDKGREDGRRVIGETGEGKRGDGWEGRQDAGYL